MGSISPRMENRFASNLFFTFETKAPKIVQEKWAAFPAKMENRFASNDLPFFTFETKAPKVVQENGQHFP